MVFLVNVLELDEGPDCDLGPLILLDIIRAVDSSV